MVEEVKAEAPTQKETPVQFDPDAAAKMPPPAQNAVIPPPERIPISDDDLLPYASRKCKMCWGTGRITLNPILPKVEVMPGQPKPEPPPKPQRICACAIDRFMRKNREKVEHIKTGRDTSLTVWKKEFEGASSIVKARTAAQAVSAAPVPPIAVPVK